MYRCAANRHCGFSWLRATTIPLALAAAAACGPASESPFPPTAATFFASSADHRKLVLAFEGGEIELAAAGDSARDRSATCGALVPPFDHLPFGDQRDAVIADIVAAVADIFGDLPLEITAVRPPSGTYHMVMVGGTPALCGRPAGLGGLGPLDCNDTNPADVAFVFSAPLTAIEGIALTIAHETGHMLGLPHNTEPCDVMSNLFCLDKRFLDQEMDVAPDHLGQCGLQRANSYRLALAALTAPQTGDGGADAASPGTDAGPGVDAGPSADAGPGPDAALVDAAALPGDGADDPGGCSLASGGISPPLGALFLLVFLVAGRRSARHLLKLPEDLGWAYSTSCLPQPATRTPTRIWSSAACRCRRCCTPSPRGCGPARRRLGSTAR